MRQILVHMLVYLMLCSCGRGQEAWDLPALDRFVQDPANGLTKERVVNGVRTSVTLLPAELTALREHLAWKDDSCYDALGTIIEKHRRTITFILKLAPDGSHRKEDIMGVGAATIAERRAQAFDLNFGWEERVELRCGDRVYKPLLSTLENTYGLTTSRNVLLVFGPDSSVDEDLNGSEELLLVVNDEILGTGVQRFRFDRDALRDFPRPTL